MGDATSLLPPLLAIGLAIWTRQVHLSLFAGIWVGASLLTGDPFSGLARGIEACVMVFSDAGNTRVIMFSALVGSMIALARASGGVIGFVRGLTESGWVQNRRRAMMLSWIIGLVIFIESSLTSLINGSVCRPLFDRFGISRAKLAYLCDTTSAPICVLLPLNGWAAYVLGLLAAAEVENPLALFLSSVPLNFYAWFAVLGALFVIWTDWNIGPMKQAEAEARPMDVDEAEGSGAGGGADLEAIEPGPAKDFLIPIAVMVLCMPFGLWVTGEGDLLAGSGSTSVLWAVLGACVVSGALLLLRGRARVNRVVEIVFDGVGELMPLASLLILAFAIGAITKELGTGAYMARAVSANLNPAFIPTAVFLVACGIAFSTGTSWGTFALMVPIALPMVAAHPDMLPLAVACVLGGGVFGDHCSPISDTTMISSLAAGCDHIEHVRTQLPYALIGGGVTIVVLLVMGLVLS